MKDTTPTTGLTFRMSISCPTLDCESDVFWAKSDGTFECVACREDFPRHGDNFDYDVKRLSRATWSPE